MGLRLKEQKGPRHAPTPGLRGQGTSPGSPAGFLGSNRGANTLLPSPAPPIWSLGGPLPPASPDLPCLSPMPITLVEPAELPSRCTALQTPHQGEQSPAPLPLFPESLPPASPDLPSLRGTDPVWFPLLLPPQSPYILPVHSGVLPISLCVRVPHQQPAGALVVGRRYSLPTPSS